MTETHDRLQVSRRASRLSQRARYHRERSTTQRVLKEERKQTKASEMCLMAPHGFHLATVSVAMVTVLHN